MSVFSRPGTETRILRGTCADPTIRDEVAGRSCGVVLLAGDPSVRAVLADLEWAEDGAADGAVVGLDGHGDKTRPGVSEALTERFANGSRLRLMGQVGTAACLRASAT
ncbi:hypothetical protein ACFXOS_14525 [Streptomyces sp. NPDC059175]|uniref:hypothetical protein n=1 Tax=Streptomyces sp. NPDC059175 TaxID=3346757 RepID=UPI003695296D